MMPLKAVRVRYTDERVYEYDNIHGISLNKPLRAYELWVNPTDKFIVPMNNIMNIETYTVETE